MTLQFLTSWTSYLLHFDNHTSRVETRPQPTPRRSLYSGEILSEEQWHLQSSRTRQGVRPHTEVICSLTSKGVHQHFQPFPSTGYSPSPTCPLPKKQAAISTIVMNYLLWSGHPPVCLQGEQIKRRLYFIHLFYLEHLSTYVIMIFVNLSSVFQYKSEIERATIHHPLSSWILEHHMVVSTVQPFHPIHTTAHKSNPLTLWGSLLMTQLWWDWYQEMRRHTTERRFNIWLSGDQNWMFRTW